jgi:YD repeat-containing protein
MTTDLVGTTTTTYDEDGNRLSYVWDNRSYLAELTAPGIDTIGEWTYDEHGNMTSELWYEGDGSFREGWSWGWECH